MTRATPHPFATRAVAGALCVLSACGGDEGEAVPTTDGPPRTSAATTAPDTTVPATTVPEATLTETTAPVTSAATTTSSTTTPSTAASPATAAVPATGVTVPPERWHDPDGVYRVDFPTEPSPTELEVALPDGSTLPVTAYVAELAGAAAISSCVKYPDGTVVDPTPVLEGARDGALANIGADIVDSEPIELQGRPGVAFRGSIGEAGAVMARTFLDGLELCQVLVVGEPAVVGEIAPPLLESFEFLQEAA